MGPLSQFNFPTCLFRALALVPHAVDLLLVVVPALVPALAPRAGIVAEDLDAIIRAIRTHTAAAEEMEDSAAGL